ncbi:MAG: hypothetical protein WCT46_01900 [Candidatus Gracilibacteria bacterium]|jgi:hypothetical protein
MNSKIKAILYTLLIGTVLVPVLYMNGVNAEDATCYYPISGNTSDSYYENTGPLDFDSGDVCIGEDGAVSGQVESLNIGTIYFGGSYGDPATVNFIDGTWTGTAYAPLNPYNQASTQGVLFDLSDVETDLGTGDISGHGDSTNLGELSFTGASQTLPAFEVGIDIELDTFGHTRAIDGYPVADGASGWKIKAILDFNDVPFEVTDSFFSTEFNFIGSINTTDDSNLRLDQIGGDGSANDAVSGSDDAFVYESYNSDTKEATYYLNISSFAPTSDAYCGDVDSSEYCFSSDVTYTYGIESIDIQGIMIDGEFTWTGLETTSNTYSGFVLNAATVTDIPQETLPFAPVYEMDDFGVIGEDGTRADSLDEVPTLAEDVLYEFTGTLVKNGDTDGITKTLNSEYSIDAAGYTFGAEDCGASEFSIPFTDSALGVMSGKPIFAGAFTNMELCPPDSSSLGNNTVAMVNNSFEVNFVQSGKIAYYGSEYFTFSDRRAGVWEDPRAYIAGTVSGLVESDDTTIVGNVAKMELRDQLFEEFTKITRGVEPTTGGGRVNSSWEAAIGGVELDDGNVLYFVGGASGKPIKIAGGSLAGVSATIVVVGADVFIESNIKKVDGEGELGIIVFAEDGVGGNLYVGSDVTDLQANIFLDGSLFRGDEDGVPYVDKASDLKNQFYLFGSIVSENTIGDDTDTDLSYASYFQICCIGSCSYNDDGELTTGVEDLEVCTGYDQSAYDGDYWMVPVIIEYNPPSAEMPIFSAEGR